MQTPRSIGNERVIMYYVVCGPEAVPVCGVIGANMSKSLIHAKDD